MLYVETIENIRHIVRAAGSVKAEQLIRFFSEEEDAFYVDYFVHILVANRVLDYDRVRDIVSWHSRPLLTEAEVSRRIKAFWVVAAMKSNFVYDVIPLAYPSQFLVISADKMAYEITVCGSALDAQIAVRQFNSMLPEGQEDEVNHIALVPSEQVAMELKGYGFDSYCILDEDYNPKYGTWD